jgi:hypothetical protein
MSNANREATGRIGFQQQCGGETLVKGKAARARGDEKSTLGNRRGSSTLPTHRKITEMRRAWPQPTASN